MQKLIIANWKTNPNNWEKGKEIILNTFEFLKDNSQFKHDIYFSVPAIYFGFAVNLINEQNKFLNKGFLNKIKHVFVDERKAKVGVQDIFWAEEGAYTGKFGAEMSKSVGTQYAIIGHSETRENQLNKKGYSNEEITQKVDHLLDNNLEIILCIGEEKRDENWKQEITTQLKCNLQNVKENDWKNIIIAYEPVWAIGKNAIRSATEIEIVDSINFIKYYLMENYDKNCKQVKIVYGGSVDENNIKNILDLEMVDGVLVGRASADRDKWLKLLNKSF